MEIKTGVLPNSKNYKIGRSESIKYIVIHYTANKGDTALNNVKYFHNNKVSASAHFFVDENGAYTSVPVTDTAYHCGGKLQGNTGHSFYGKCKNQNSIGIELCIWDKQGNIRQGTIDNAVELTKSLMQEYNVSAECVIRHWDVTGKECPKPMIGNNNTLWNDFKSRLEGNAMTKEERIKFNQLVDAVTDLTNQVDGLSKKMVYNYIDDNTAKIAEDANDALRAAQKKGILKGGSDGLNLTEDLVRIHIWNYRLGLYD